MRRLLLLLAALSAAGCAAERYYVYRPAEQATATLAGRRAARYGIPPESPRGSARVAAVGISSADTAYGEERLLHVRLALANNNDTGPWELDAAALRVEYEGGTPVAPAFVNTGSPGAPSLQIPPGGSARVDAYFPLPAGAEGAEDVPRFDLIWEVSTPDRDVAERTPFDRISLAPNLGICAGGGFGVEPGWWYDPVRYPWAPVLVASPPRVYVRRP